MPTRPSATSRATPEGVRPVKRRRGHVRGEGRRLHYATDSCSGCKLCYSRCPVKCIDITVKSMVIDSLSCRGCGNCAEICPKQAVKCMVRPGDAEKYVDISSMDGVARGTTSPAAPWRPP